MERSTDRYCFKSIAAILIMCVFASCLTGCGNSEDKYRKQLKSAYPEWYEYLSPALDDVTVTEYKTASGMIQIGVENKSSENSFVKLAKLHNEFIGKNPAYFTNSERFYFCKYKSGKFQCCLASYPNINIGSYRKIENKNEVFVGENGKLIYGAVAYDDIGSLYDTKGNYLLKDVNVLFLDICAKGKDSLPASSDWNFLSKFTGLEKIVLITNWEYDANEKMYSAINSYHPKFTIYTSSL